MQAEAVCDGTKLACMVNRVVPPDSLWIHPDTLACLPTRSASLMVSRLMLLMV